MTTTQRSAIALVGGIGPPLRSRDALRIGTRRSLVTPGRCIATIERSPQGDVLSGRAAALGVQEAAGPT